MGPLLIALLVLLGGLLLVGLWLMGLYNGLVRLRQAVKNAFANIDVQLKRRHDLIPNLVNTVKGYASHEKDTLERVVNARARAKGAAQKRAVIIGAQAQPGAKRAKRAPTGPPLAPHVRRLSLSHSTLLAMYHETFVGISRNVRSVP